MAGKKPRKAAASRAASCRSAPPKPCARRAPARPRWSKGRGSALPPTKGRRRRDPALDAGRDRGSVPPVPGRRCPTRRASSSTSIPITLLVAVVLSAQATDAGVNKATPALFAAADTPEKMAALGEARCATSSRPSGSSAPRRRTSSRCRRSSSPSTAARCRASREALEALPGVGRKTANVVLNIAFGEPTIAVDTHIFRVGNRTGLAPGKTPFEVELKLEERGAGALQAPRPSLADPARPLHLRCAQAAVREMPDRRPVQVAGQDG